MNRYIAGMLCLVYAATCAPDHEPLHSSPFSTAMFRHHFIERGNPLFQKLRNYGVSTMSDFDKDGDLDYACGVLGGRMYWFEYQAADTWVRHDIGALTEGALGGSNMDVDGDGWTDIIACGVWYRNPGTPSDKGEWESYVFNDGIQTEIHDIVCADMDGNRTLEVVLTGDHFGCYWYRVPENPRRNVQWERTTITMDVTVENDHIHAGFFPSGIGDLDGDGDADVVLADRWYENSGHGIDWEHHYLPWGQRSRYGLSGRSWIIDLDGDGDQDVVVTDSDETGSRAGWLEHNGKTTPVFSRHLLPQNIPGTRGSFHSLQVGDFDNDGDPDIFAAEQQASNILPEGAGPRCYIWENTDGSGQQWTEHIVFDGMLGFHDVQAGDVDGDGDIDFCSKIWRPWADSAVGNEPHVDFLENLLIS